MKKPKKRGRLKDKSKSSEKKHKPTSGWVESYHAKYSKPIESRGGVTNRWLSRYFEVKDGSKSTITTFSGGNFAFPFDDIGKRNMYYKNQEKDIQKNIPLSLNEITKKLRNDQMSEPSSVLALELDYRFDNPRAVPNAAFFEEHIRVANNIVKMYFSKNDANGVRLMVFRCEPKPKVKEGRWIVAYGIHLIYNRRVINAAGAQISKAVSDRIGSIPSKYDMSDVVDNIYIGTSKRAPIIKKSVSLRPPYSCKKVPCFFCNDPTLRKSDDPEIAQSIDIECAKCSNGSVLDTNVYKLDTVYTLDNVVDTQITKHLKENISVQLSHASIWGAHHPHATIIKSPSMPTYTDVDLRKPKLPPLRYVKHTPLHRQVIRDIRKASITNAYGEKGLTIPFSTISRHTKSETGIPVEINNFIHERTSHLLGNISPEYAKCYFLIVEYPKSGFIHIKPRGIGSTFCMVKGCNHSMSTANIFIGRTTEMLYTIYAGCWSRKCHAQFTKVTHCNYEDVQEFMDIFRK